MTEPATSDLSLIVRRAIKADAVTLFDAWTQPSRLVKWWGPKNVTCLNAKIDLTQGGKYSITNQLEDGSVLVINGVFELIQRPEKLIYTWSINATSKDYERVTVLFKPQGDNTEVIVRHEKVSSEAILKSHNLGWQGCLEKLNLLAKGY